MSKAAGEPKQSFVTVNSDALEGYGGHVEIYSASGKPRGIAKVASATGNELNLRQASLWRRLVFRVKSIWKQRGNYGAREKNK